MSYSPEGLTNLIARVDGQIMFKAANPGEVKSSKILIVKIIPILNVTDFLLRLRPCSR